MKTFAAASLQSEITFCYLYYFNVISLTTSDFGKVYYYSQDNIRARLDKKTSTKEETKRVPLEVIETMMDFRKKMIDMIEKKFQAKVHRTYLEDFILKFPLIIITKPNLKIASRYVNDYIDFLVDLNRKSGIFKPNKKEYLGLYSEWKNNLKIDFFNLKEVDTSLILRLNTDGEIDYISENTIIILNKLINNAKIKILKAYDCLMQKNDSIIHVSDEEIYSPESKDPTIKKVAEVKSKYQNINYDKRNKKIVNSFQDNYLINEAQPIFLESDRVNKIFRNVNNIFQITKTIPPRFIEKPGSFVPNLKLNEFKISNLLDAFDLISITDGFFLDYIYYYTVKSGEPFPYTYNNDEERLENIEEYCAKYGLENIGMLLGSEPNLKSSFPYTRDLIFKKNSYGFFQFTMFCMLLRRFYLAWHSGYNHRIYFTDKEELTKHIDLNLNKSNSDFSSSEDPSIVENLDITPKIQLINDWAKVTIVTYEMNRGYTFMSAYVMWPNIFFKIEDKIILKNKMTILY